MKSSERAKEIEMESTATKLAEQMLEKILLIFEDFRGRWGWKAEKRITSAD